MINFQRRTGWRNIVYAKPVLILLGVLTLLFAVVVFRFMLKMEDTIKNKNIAEAKVLELQQEQAKLSSDIASLKTDKGIEANIRDKFGLAKVGEGEIVVMDDPNNPPPPPAPTGFWGFIKNLFK